MILVGQQVECQLFFSAHNAGAPKLYGGFSVAVENSTQSASHIIRLFSTMYGSYQLGCKTLLAIKCLLPQNVEYIQRPVKNFL